MKQTPPTAFSGAVSSHDKRRRSRGQSLVEFAIFVPIMLLILLIAVDFGRVFLGWVSVQNMARIGANYAAINPTAWEAPDNSDKASKRSRYRELMTADATAINCTLPSPLGDPVFGGYVLGSNVRVDVSCSFPLITPFLSSVVGDGAGNVAVGATTNFIVRTGSIGGPSVGGPGLPSPTAPMTPPPTAPPTADPGPTPTVDPSASAPPPPPPTFPPVTVGFHGDPTSSDSQGGGPAPSPGLEGIVGIPTLAVSFRNTTVGDQWTCLWDFGDGTTSNSCGNNVSKSYATRGSYHVTLTVNGQSLTRPGYVLVGCKVPSFAGVRKNAASGLWTNPVVGGFDAANFSALAGSGNYQINYQSLAGGLLNPPGGCSGATIQVGP